MQAVLLATILALTQPLPPGAKPKLSSPKDAVALTPMMMPAPPALFAASNQPPVAVIEWHIAPGDGDADPTLTNGAHCDILNDGDAARLEFFARSNHVYELQVKAQFWEPAWRVVLRFETNSYRNDGVMKVRYPYDQVPVDIPSRFFRVMSD